MRKTIRECLDPGHRGADVDDRFDKLAQNVFLAEKENDQVLKYYMPATPKLTPALWRKITSGLSKPVVSRLGDYELRLLDKIIFPVRPTPILCVVGAIGSGKSMTVRMVLHSLNEYSSRVLRIDRPLICYFNLNEYRQMTDKAELYRELCRALVGTLSTIAPELVNMEYEIQHFWPQIVGDKNSAYPHSVRGALLNELKQQSLLQFTDTTERLDDYRAVYRILASNDTWYFQYLLLLWREIKNTVYRGRPAVSLIAIDNVDWEPPVIQEELISMILPYSGLSDTPLLMTMRPSFYYHRRVGARLVDVETHFGPKPFDVMMDCLRKFKKAPARFCKNTVMEKLEDRQQFVRRLAQLHEVMSDDGVFRHFVESLFGDNKRAALASGQSVLKFANEDAYAVHRPSAHELNRLLIRRGEVYYKYQDNTEIDNLFHIGGGRHESLVKSRLLLFLSVYGREDVPLQEVCAHLRLFGYSDGKLTRALNQLMEPTRQLVLSSAQNRYTGTNLAEAADDSLYLTPMGKGYISRCVFDCDYVSEVIMDCTVDDYDFPHVSLAGLKGRFQALRVFLKLLAQRDYDEIVTFQNEVEKTEPDKGRERYEAYYGFDTLSFRIRERILEATCSIFRSIIQDARRGGEQRLAEFKKPYADILQDMYSDHLQNADILKRILDRVPETELSIENTTL